MFAPKVATPQTRAAEKSTSKLVSPRSTFEAHQLGKHPIEPALFRQRTIGNQATLRLLARWNPVVPGSGRNNDEVHAIVGERTPAETATAGISRSFSRSAISPSERASRARPPLSPATLPRAIRAPSTIQPKLKIGAVDDPLEHDADRVAEQVTQMTDYELPADSASTNLRRKCESCAEEENRQLQTMSDGTSIAPGPEAPASVHGVLGSAGKPLDACTRAFFEPRFGRGFEAVRIHDDSQAGRSAQDVGALAYASGHHIVVDPANYRPGTPEGRRLLAHELAHVAQQVPGGTETAMPHDAHEHPHSGKWREPEHSFPRRSSPLQLLRTGGVAQPAPTFSSTPVLQRALREGADPQDWPTWARASGPLSPEQNAAINQILTNRTRIPVRRDLRFVGTEGGSTVSGMAYGGKPGQLAPDAPRYLAIAMREYWATEGGVASINTWDRPVRQAYGNFTLGPGLLNVNAASAMRQWIDNDEAVAAACLTQLGIWVTPKLEWVVVVGPNDIRSGREAISFLNDQHIVSGIMDLAEKGHGAALDKAEQDWVTKNEVAAVPPEAASWDDAAIAVCMHIDHGASAYGWRTNRAAYVATGGNPMEIARTFAVVTNRRHIFPRIGDNINGPILVTRQWGALVYEIFSLWGIGGGSRGYLKTAIDSGTPISGTKTDIGKNPDLQGHILYQTGSHGALIQARDIGLPTTA